MLQNLYTDKQKDRILYNYHINVITTGVLRSEVKVNSWLIISIDI